MGNIPEEDKIGQDIQQRHDLDKASGFFVAKEFRICHILGLVLWRPNLAADFPDQTWKIHGKGQQNGRKRQERQIVLIADERNRIEIQNHHDRIMGHKSQWQRILNLVTLEEPEGHEGSVDIEKEEPADIVHKEDIEQH